MRKPPDRDDATPSLCMLSGWAAAGPAPTDAALSRAARVLADNLAATVAAAGEPEVARAHAAALTAAGAPQATIFRGGRPRTDRLTAAAANALAMVWLELEEGYRRTACHAGLYVLPALLAEAEARDLRVGAVLHHLAVGYEIVTRIARSWEFPVLAAHGRGWVHGRFCAPGAAAAAALARGFDGDDMAAAIATAATFATSVPRRHHVEGVLSWNATPAVGAWSGMMAAEWVAAGMGAPATALYDVYAGELQGVADPSTAADGLGEEWAILDGYTKLYGCIQHAHAAVEAALALRPRLLATGPLDRILEIRIDTHPMARVLDSLHPATTLAARFSLPHIVAATLVHGDAGVEAFSTASLTAPEVAALRARCRLAAFEPLPGSPHDRPSRLVLQLRDGTVIEETCLSARGGADRPFPDELVADKIATLTGPIYPRFAGLLSSLAADPAAHSAQRWSDFVAEICG